MKSENEKLKDIFTNNLGKGVEIPQFESMWRRAAELKRVKRIMIWKIAASIVLIATIASLLTLKPAQVRHNGGMQISSWSEPTRFLVADHENNQMTDLVHWTSPTGSLLKENNLK